MKKRILAVLLSLLIAFSCITMSGCWIVDFWLDVTVELTNFAADLIGFDHHTSNDEEEEYPYGYPEMEDNGKNPLIGLAYTKKEIVAAANALFETEFEVVETGQTGDSQNLTRYTLRSEDYPFDIAVYTRVLTYDGGYSCEAWCDYYEKVMKYKAAEAEKIAEKYELDLSIDGQTVYAKVGSYSQIADVCSYLCETNELYDFRINESEINGILGQISIRPNIQINFDEKILGKNYFVQSVYYTINEYEYKPEQLCCAMQDRYLRTHDAYSLDDKTVTDEIRAEKKHTPINDVRLNGEKLKAKWNNDSHEFLLNPSVKFEYNWEYGEYLGDIRICAPSEDYDAKPGVYGDDRDFRYLVELLGGEYTSKAAVDTPQGRSCKAEWTLGGRRYNAHTVEGWYIPISAGFYCDGEELNVPFRNSKEMWGLENGYGTEDFYVRVTPEELALILGLEVEINLEENYINFITPDGYFEAAAPEKLKEYFSCEYLADYSGSRYEIYDRNGIVIDSGETSDTRWAQLTQINENIVEVCILPPGNTEYIYYDIDTGAKSELFTEVAATNGELVVYYDTDAKLVTVCDIFDKSIVQTFLPDNLDHSNNPISSAKFSDDGKQLELTYTAYIDGEWPQVTATVELEIGEQGKAG